MYSSLSARHGRLLSAAGRWREDLARYIGATRIHRLPTDGRRERSTNVSQNSRHRYDSSNYTVSQNTRHFLLIAGISLFTRQIQPVA